MKTTALPTQNKKCEIIEVTSSSGRSSSCKIHGFSCFKIMKTTPLTTITTKKRKCVYCARPLHKNNLDEYCANAHCAFNKELKKSESWRRGYQAGVKAERERNESSKGVDKLSRLSDTDV